MWSRKAEDFAILIFTKDLLFGLMLKMKLERIFNAGISLVWAHTASRAKYMIKMKMKLCVYVPRLFCVVPDM